MKLSLNKIWEETEQQTKQKQADPNKTKQYNVVPNPLTQQSQQDVNDQYEQEGYFDEPMVGPNGSVQNYPNSGGDLPYQTPTTQGGWQKSTVPQTPQVNQGIEDFSNQIEEDSPPVNQRRGLRPPPNEQQAARFNPKQRVSVQTQPNSQPAAQFDPKQRINIQTQQPQTAFNPKQRMSIQTPAAQQSTFDPKKRMKLPTGK